MEQYDKQHKIEFNEDDIQAMKPLDGILALLYYIFYMILIFGFGLFMIRSNTFVSWWNHFDNKYLYRFIIYIPYTVLSILPAILIIYFRKQKIRTLGIRRVKIMKSLFMGIIFSLPALIPSIISGIINNHNLRDIDYIKWDFLYYLICIALVEEMIFRGFIQLRIRGLIKNKWLSIWLVGFMFSAIHIPLQVMQANVSIIEFIQHNISNLIMISIIHIYFVYIYTRDNNIIAPIITHAIWNFSNYLFVGYMDIF